MGRHHRRGRICFVHGKTAPAPPPDGRTSVLLSAGERDVVLAEMRLLLAAVRGISEGLAHGDRAEIATAARGVGMAAAHDAAPALMVKLPLDFKRMASADAWIPAFALGHAHIWTTHPFFVTAAKAAVHGVEAHRRRI